MARVRAENAPLSRCHLGELPPDTQTTAPPYDPAAVPLEVMVERQPRAAGAADTPGDARMLALAVDAGLHFLRMLRAAAAVGRTIAAPSSRRFARDAARRGQRSPR